MNRRSVAGEWHSFLRPFPAGESSMPIGVRSVGRYRVQAGWRDRTLQKFFCELFWCVSGKGAFELDGHTYTLGAEEAIILLPGEWHRIRSLGDWSYRWITYDGPMSEAMIKSMPVNQRVFAAGPCPHTLFDRVESHIQSPDLREQFICSASGLEILYSVIANCSKVQGDLEPSCGERTFEDALRLIEDGLGSPSFDVTRLAEKLGVHRTTLTRLFKARLLVSPLKYIKAKRLQRAIELLKSGREPVKGIAEMTGFASPEYFIRSVRGATGMTPGALRKTYGR